jgi:hypothetical protein
MSTQKGAFDRQHDDWQRQVLADPAIPSLGFLKVAMVISLHFNRKQFDSGNGLVAFPGIVKTLAPLTGLSARTVMRAIQWLEARGHFKVARKQVDKKKNEVNKYLALRRTVAQLNAVPKAPRHNTRVTRVVTPGVTLLSELPMTLCKNIATSGDVVLNNSSTSEGRKIGDIRESKGISIESPSSTIRAECYRLARDFEGEVGASRVGMALREDGYGREEEILERIRDTIAEGGDLGEALAEFWESSWRRMA